MAANELYFRRWRFPGSHPPVHMKPVLALDILLTPSTATDFTAASQTKSLGQDSTDEIYQRVTSSDYQFK